MTYQFITSEQDDDGIVVVTINDPDAKNAVNWVMNQEMIREFERIDGGSRSARPDPDRLGTDLLLGWQHQADDGRRAMSLEPPNPTLREELYPQEADIRRVVTRAAPDVEAGDRRRERPGDRFRPRHRRRLRHPHRVRARRGSAGCSCAAASCPTMRALR